MLLGFLNSVDTIGCLSQALAEPQGLSPFFGHGNSDLIGEHCRSWSRRHRVRKWEDCGREEWDIGRCRWWRGWWRAVPCLKTALMRAGSIIAKTYDPTSSYITEPIWLIIADSQLYSRWPNTIPAHGHLDYEYGTDGNHYRQHDMVFTAVAICLAGDWRNYSYFGYWGYRESFGHRGCGDQRNGWDEGRRRNDGQTVCHHFLQILLADDYGVQPENISVV